MMDFDYEKSLGKNVEGNWFFTLFFPLKWFFLHWDHLVWKSFFKKETTLSDIPKVSKDKTVQNDLKKFIFWWKVFKGKAGGLFWSMQFAFGLKWWFSGFLMASAQALSVFTPRLMKEFLMRLMPLAPAGFETMFEQGKYILPPAYWEKYPLASSLPFRTDDWQAWIWLAAFAGSFLLSAFFQVTATHMSTQVGMSLRTVVNAAMYNKSLRLSNKARSYFNNGRIINFISTDTLKIEGITSMFHYGWSSLITLAGGIYFLIDWLCNYCRSMHSCWGCSISCFGYDYYDQFQKGSS